MKVVAISGHAGSGKDTLADIIILADTWKNSKYFQRMFPDKAAFIRRFLTNHSITINACSNIQKVAFAGKLKQALAIITDTPLECWSDQVFKNAPNMLGLTNEKNEFYTNRELLQIFGTEVGRNINQDIWIEALFVSLEDAGNYIITDLRFENEAKAIKDKLNGKLIRINRESVIMPHDSETGLDNYNEFDIVIDNNGTIDDLINKVIDLNLYE